MIFKDFFTFTVLGQSSDEALKKLIQKAKPTAMVSEATKSSVSLSTEFGNSNDALLAALLKEQGFGPTTASSLDEQVRLAVSFFFSFLITLFFRYIKVNG